MAYSWLSGDDVLTNIFGDEESLDDSDSESGDDIYGYLGAFVLPHDELEEESHILTGVDEVENELSGEHTLSNNEEPLGDTHSESDMEQSDHSCVEYDEMDASGSIVADLETFSQHSNEANDEANDMEVVSEFKLK